MDTRLLNLDMENYAISGLFLSPEEQLLLRATLTELQNSSKFTTVSFWGKIFGNDCSYYIAQGRGKDFIRNKMSFYSLDGYVWRVLYPPKDEDMTQLHLLRTRFTGDPTTQHSYFDPSMDPEQFDMKGVMKEEDRLSALVKTVDIETAIAPKQAFILDQEGVVKRNHVFKGLLPLDAVKQSSYHHLRLPDTDAVLMPSLESCPSGPNRATNFLEPIDHDVPAGCWTVHADELMEVVTLRNLWWPGFSFYHKPKTSEFGGIYIGYGERNDDLPFML